MFQKPSSDSLLSSQEMPNRQDHDDVETVVGPSVHVEGDFASEGNILVKGMVSGNVKTSKLLTVEPGAKISANVKAGNAIISGEIKGNVRVADRLEVTGTAQIAGDIVCKVLVVEAGALLHGKVAMKGIDIELPSKSKTSRRSSVRRSTRSAQGAAQEGESSEGSSQE